MAATSPQSSDQELMSVMRQLSLAMALVADSRDQGRPAMAATAQGYLREALAILERIEKKPQ